MNRIKTQSLLTLGMALTSDRKTMERRVRGVFARRKSARGVLVLSTVLVLALGFAAFTTACQPGQSPVSSGNAPLVSGGDAIVSGGNAPASSANAALAAVAKNEEESQVVTKASVMKDLTDNLAIVREFTVPRLESNTYYERGSWQAREVSDDVQTLAAANRFLEIANVIFSKAYTPDDLTVTYYIDQTGFRADVWRIDSKDGVLSGALEGKTLAFLSADCINEPVDALHASATNRGKLSVETAVELASALLGATAGDIDVRTGVNPYDPSYGWMIKSEALFPLGDGRYGSINVFGDEKLTPTTLCVFPDEDCANEGVFWRADLQNIEGTIQMLHPQKRAVGEPTKGDLTRQDALAIFDKFIETAGLAESADKNPPQPEMTFYLDRSGARGNYWHIEGSGVSMDVSSPKASIFAMHGKGDVGGNLGLSDLPPAKLGKGEYLKATRAFFSELFGADSVKTVEKSFTYGNNYCSISVNMTDGSVYAVSYQNGMIVDIVEYFSMDMDTWPDLPDWLKDWAKVDPETGKTLVAGMQNGYSLGYSGWLADYIYLNNETGEIFLKAY